MNSEPSEEQKEFPSKELIQSLGWTEESPGVYVAGAEIVRDVGPSSLVTIDPAVWDEKLDQVMAEAAELIEQRSEVQGESVQVPEPVENAASGEFIETAADAELNDAAESKNLSSKP